MNRRKYITGLLSIVGSLTAKPEYAATTGFLVQDPQVKYFEYDYDELLESAVQNTLEFPSPLYDDYMLKTLVAFHDDPNGYVDKDAVLQAAVDAELSGSPFVGIGEGGYTESQEAKDNVLQDISGVTKLTVENGQVVPVDGTGEDTSDDFEVADIY